MAVKVTVSSCLSIFWLWTFSMEYVSLQELDLSIEEEDQNSDIFFSFHYKVILQRLHSHNLSLTSSNVTSIENNTSTSTKA